MGAVVGGFGLYPAGGGGGDGGVTTVGTIDSQPKSDDGAIIDGVNIYFQTADSSFPGMLSLDAQDIKGVKTFFQSIVLDNLTPGSILFLDGSKRVAQDNTNFFWDDANNIFYTGANSGAFTNTKIHAQATVNSYSQINSINLSNGTSASTDFIATADTGTDTTNYADFGINSSTYSDSSFTIVGPLDTYLYGNGGNVAIGTATAAKTIKFHTGGTLAANLRATIADTSLAMVGLLATDTFTGQTAATNIDGLKLINATPATVVAGQVTTTSQFGPGFVTQGTAWNVTGAVSVNSSARMSLTTFSGNATGAASYSSSLSFQLSFGGAAYTSNIFDIWVNANGDKSLLIGRSTSVPAFSTGATGYIIQSTTGGGILMQGSGTTTSNFAAALSGDANFATWFRPASGKSALGFGSNGAAGSAAITWDTTFRVGIGAVTTPTAFMHLPAGTGTANTAPLQINVGTSETTARSGVVQFSSASSSGIQAPSGSRFTLTESDTTERYILQAATSVKTTAAAPYTNDGFISAVINGTTVKLMTTA